MGETKSIADMALGKMLDVAKNKGSLRPYLRNVNVRWGTFELSDVLDMRLKTTNSKGTAFVMALGYM